MTQPTPSAPMDSSETGSDSRDVSLDDGLRFCLLLLHSCPNLQLETASTLDSLHVTLTSNSRMQGSSFSLMFTMRLDSSTLQEVAMRLFHEFMNYSRFP